VRLGEDESNCVGDLVPWVGVSSGTLLGTDDVEEEGETDVEGLWIGVSVGPSTGTRLGIDDAVGDAVVVEGTLGSVGDAVP
jgi:hypothetical protein